MFGEFETETGCVVVRYERLDGKTRDDLTRQGERIVQELRDARRKIGSADVSGSADVDGVGVAYAVAVDRNHPRSDGSTGSDGRPRSPFLAYWVSIDCDAPCVEIGV